ncbi:glycerophosphodiester phosphodiesterase family protein [Mucilaginibacter sp. RCC_168]|uniref:glycerophosphodiester phosphodiesterase family protein n=1 Tax=Mucilaginibacter sp. RCC_168 TaxID=3239221 RepID=UPI0035265BC1
MIPIKNIISLYFFLVPVTGFCQSKNNNTINNIQQHYQWTVEQLNNKNSKSVLVTAHRCDWRNSPENSVQALKNCIAMGVDIAEFDMGKTKDGRLIIMHDKTIDRSTNGKGKPEDYTLAEIRKFRLKSGTGHPTVHPIPTFNEMLAASKGKIIIDIDKGYEYYDEIIQKLDSAKMFDQSIFNIYSLPLDSVKAHHQNIPEELTLQVIVNPKDSNAENIISSYKSHRKTIIQIIFSNDADAILGKVPALKKSYSIWFNALWPEQNGGHDDDTAVEENKPDETWGWLISHGANIIQTDRPRDLLNYLRSGKLHP